MHGKVTLSKEDFDKLDEKYFISHSSETTKYMCANPEETEHLRTLGVDMDGVVCDWFEICLEEKAI